MDDLENWRNDPSARLIAQTPAARVYRVQREGSSRILKELSETGRREVSDAVAALDYWGGEGAVRLLACEPDALLLEDAGPETALRLFDRDPARATQEAARVLTLLHRASRPRPPSMTTLAHHFRALTEKHHDDPLLQETASLARRLLAEPRGEVVLHGDLHHENLAITARGPLALDPKGVRGEPAYDSTIWLYNPMNRPWRPQRALADLMTFADVLQIEPVRLQDFAFAAGGLRAAWFLEDGQEDLARQALAQAVYLRDGLLS